MPKTKKANSQKLFLVFAVIWFIAVTIIAVQTSYQNGLIYRLINIYEIPLQLEAISPVLIMLASFMPCGIFATYHYVKSNFSNYIALRLITVSLAVSLALYVPFAWIDFTFNFSK